jgi:NADPH-dependent 2,4-dienoyl-CoA reductase/sulfur reductase-like enzyme
MKVTVLDEEEFILAGRFGYEVSLRIVELMREQNVEVLMGSRITKQSGNLDYFLESVELEDGRVLKVDLMVISVEKIPATTFLKESGINVNEDGTVPANQHLQTNIPDIYVGGSILSSFHQQNYLGHSGIPQYQGKIAALNMLGKKTENNSPPYFWFEINGKFFTFVGQEEYDSLYIDGDLKELRIDVFYFDLDENLTAVLSCRPNDFALEFADVLADERKFGREELEKKLGEFLFFR